jgi:uncharacterized cupredoxin-like copper-binding protein
MEKRGRRLSVGISLFLLLGILAACTPAPRAAQSTAAVPVTGNSVVNVNETEYKLDMPATAPAGPVTFHVTNSGTIPHNFEVTGGGIDQKLPADLNPGQSSDLKVTLAPGQYNAFCPVDGHKGLGMMVTLTVQ